MLSASTCARKRAITPTADAGQMSEIACAENFDEPRRLEQRGARRLLVEAVLENEPAAFGEMPCRTHDEGANRGQSICPGAQRNRRLEPQIAFAEIGIGGGDIRRIGDD